MKLTPVFNFIKILRAAFAPIFFCQKITKSNCNYVEKSCAKLFCMEKGARNMLVKLTPIFPFILSLALLIIKRMKI